MLPTDEEFLESLYAKIADHDYSRRLSGTLDVVTSRDHVALMREVGLPGAAADLAAVEEVLTPSQAYRGKFVEYLREKALSACGDDRSLLEAIPVGLMPTSDINGYVLPTPGGGAVIIINHSLLTTLNMVVRVICVIGDWDTDTPVTQEPDLVSYIEGLIGLAAEAATDDMGYVRPFKDIVTLPKLNPYDIRFGVLINAVALFMLLHEYGHVALGHVGSHMRHTQSRQSDEPQQVSSVRWDQEFEADAYAIRKLQAFYDQIPLARIADVGLTAQFLLRFVSLVTIFTGRNGTETHPPPKERWKRIRSQLGIQPTDIVYCNKVDESFRLVEGGLLSGEFWLMHEAPTGKLTASQYKPVSTINRDNDK